MKKVLIVLLVFIIIFNTKVFADDGYTKAKILSAQTTDEGIQYTAQIIEGKYQGLEYTDVFSGMKYTRLDYTLQKGSIILISFNGAECVSNIRLEGIYRNKYIKILAFIFAAFLILTGRKTGFVSVVSLIFTGLCIWFIFMPLVLKGCDIIVVTLIISAIVITVSFFIISGITRKSLSAILGTFGGVIAAFILIEIFSGLMCITGAVGEDVYLLVFEHGVELDFSELFISGVMIGTIGVLMDVAMSITSSVFEIKEHSPNMSYGSLVKSGINIGKDVMATMVNTLILAYAGTAMPLLFWAYASGISAQELLNLEQVSGEIIRSLCGSIGLILSVPITSVTASIIVCKR